jgi:hypothetical protein
VATERKALIFDLLALGPSPGALDAVLGPLLANPAVTKLGFDVYQDLAKLARSYPASQVRAWGEGGKCARGVRWARQACLGA